MKLEPSRVVADRYRLERLLGRGGMGSVWEATHLVTHKTVALKFLMRDAGTPEARGRFVREARAANAADHPNVLPIHDIVELDDSTLVMVMDRLVGETLGDRLARETRLPVPEAAHVVLEVVVAIAAAHAAGVVHRDLKPENIFLVADPPGVRVLDFGIAKLLEQGADARAGQLTDTGTVLGSPYYMAPEQVYCERDIDGRADVWALGVILYECLTGRRPLVGDNVGQVLKAIATKKIVPLAEVAPDLPSDLTTLVDRMVRHDRHDRLADLTEVAEVLARYVPVSATAPPRPRPSTAPRAAASPLLVVSDRARVGEPPSTSGARPAAGVDDALAATHPSLPPAGASDSRPSGDTDPSSARGATGDGPQATLGATVRESMPTSVQRAGRRAFRIGVLGGAIVVAAGLLYLTTRPPRRDLPLPPPESAQAAVSSPGSTAAAATNAPETAPSAAAEPTASGHIAATVAGPSVARARSSAGAPHSAPTTNATNATAAPAAAATATPAATATDALPGGVHGSVPF